MLTELGPEDVVLVGFSRTLLVPLADALPPASVVVVDEPDIAVKRDVPTLAREYPAISRVLHCEYQRPGAVTELARTEPALRSARAVLPGVEYAVAAAAELADVVGAPGAGARAGAIFRDKASQRRVAGAHGIRNPQYAVVASAAEAVAFAHEVGGRCVLKPTARQASLGVQFVTTPEEIEVAARQAGEVTESLLEPGRGIKSDLIVEEALDGSEYSVELLVADGRPHFANVTAKRLAPGRHPVELGHLVPAGRPALADRLVELTVRLGSACGFGSGILHCEWIVDEAGPAFVECAARMPGDEIGTLIALAYDFALTRAYLEVLLGELPAVPATARYGAAVRFLVANPGVVREVRGTEDASSSPGVHAVKVGVDAGDVVRPLCSSWDRVGYVVAKADSAPEAEARAMTAAGLVEIATSPFR